MSVLKPHDSNIVSQGPGPLAEIYSKILVFNPTVETRSSTAFSFQIEVLDALLS